MQSPSKTQSQPTPLQPNTSMFNQPIAVWAIAFASIIAFMGLGLVDPILPSIAKKLHASSSDVTLLFTSYNAVMAVAMLITGVISSRLGAKWTLVLGVVIIAVFAALGGNSNSITALVLLRGGWGLGNALFVATALAAIVSLSRTGVAKSIILFETAVGLGISVGPLLGGELGSISWRGPFFGVAILMLLAFILLIVLMPSPKANKSARKTSLADPFRALKHRALRTFGIAAFLYNFGFFTLLVYAALVLGHLGLDEHGLGFVFLGWGLLLAITSVFMAPKLQKRFGTLTSMCLMLFLFALTLFVMAQWTTDKTVVICMVILAGAFLGNNNTLITTAVMNAAPVERSTASAAYSFLRFIGGAIAPYLAGKLAEWFNPHVPFTVGGVCVMLSVIYLWANRKHLKHVDEAEGH
ncbi:major facilitator superfamily MFS_1 [Paenibacillus curdlanolyticus YK9]|uniref:Major facilitator superfamily MFS_1 n=1 Tax=Paenibacillus curdlanolyticus YK9 TaxID=717606 RepID=E0IG24_9BACL|nr:major facilitator superfamily MFS_1 [Paenibacillus curdlanolyticus YK9]